MKITEIIVEASGADAKRSENLKAVFANARAKISRTPKQAKKEYVATTKTKHPGFKNAEELVAKVGELYGVEPVDDFKDVLELPNGHESTDKEMSMFSKDNR